MYDDGLTSGDNRIAEELNIIHSYFRQGALNRHPGLYVPTDYNKWTRKGIRDFSKKALGFFGKNTTRSEDNLIQIIESLNPEKKDKALYVLCNIVGRNAHKLEINNDCYMQITALSHTEMPNKKYRITFGRYSEE